MEADTLGRVSGGETTYESYYGFSEKPFDLTTDLRFLYRSESHSNAIELLQYAIDRREGFVVITGDVGMGKTTLCRALVEKVDRRTFPALLLNHFATEEELLRAILQDLGLASWEEAHAGARRPTRQEMAKTLHDFLLSLVPLGGRAVLIIDEAQDLARPILEQVRILSNFETANDKLLQIFLIGQLSLVPLLRSPELRQLDQRVSIRYQLKPLSEEEVVGYVSHRLTVAGGRGVAFTPTALRVVHDYTGGVPRLVNVLCDRALLEGLSAQTERISEELVANAAEALDLKPLVRPQRSILNRLLGRS